MRMYCNIHCIIHNFLRFKFKAKIPINLLLTGKEYIRLFKVANLCFLSPNIWGKNASPYLIAKI